MSTALLEIDDAHNLIDPREGKGILRVGVMHVRVINTHPPLAILHRNIHDVGQPFRVLNLSDEPNSQKLINFAFYNFLTLRMESSHLPSDRLALLLEVQMVLCYGGGNTRHVGVGLCKNVSKLL